jgi:hypothetical protein
MELIHGTSFFGPGPSRVSECHFILHIHALLTVIYLLLNIFEGVNLRDLRVFSGIVRLAGISRSREYDEEFRDEEWLFKRYKGTNAGE